MNGPFSLRLHETDITEKPKIFVEDQEFQEEEEEKKN
jgi:hypothetical protein